MGTKYSQQKPMRKRTNEPKKAGQAIPLCLPRALFSAVYSNQIWMLMFSISTQMSADIRVFDLLGWALLCADLKLLMVKCFYKDLFTFYYHFQGW